MAYVAYLIINDKICPVYWKKNMETLGMLCWINIWPYHFFIESLYGVVCICLTHWGRVTHICVGKLTIIGSDNGLSPGRRQAIIWTNAGILLIGPSGTNFSEILIEIHTFSFKKMRLKVSSAKWRPFCLGLSVLTKTHVPQNILTILHE